jgi:hypothetical protein
MTEMIAGSKDARKAYHIGGIRMAPRESYQGSMVRTSRVTVVLVIAATTLLVDAKAQEAQEAQKTEEPAASAAPDPDSASATAPPAVESAAVPAAPAISPPKPANASPAKSPPPSEKELEASRIRDWDPNADESTPGAKEPPKGRYHDGLYARFSIGGGYFSSSVQASGLSLDVAGGSLAIDGMIGGSPIPGLAVGAAGFLERAFSPTVTSGEASGTLDYDVVFGTLGAFVDAFPNPSGGFHVGGVVGYSYAYLSSDHGQSTTATGFGGGGFVGYDAWVAPELSLGLVARLTAASLTDSEGVPESTLSPVSFVVAGSMLYN